MSRRVVLAAAGALILAATLLLSGPWLEIAADAPASADAIVVLGGGEPQRPQRAAALYRSGNAPAVWYTGTTIYDVVSPANLAARQLLSRGVPAAALRLLPSVSTETDAQAVAQQATLSNARALIIVTDWYHSRRALCVLRRQLSGSGIAVYYAPAAATAMRPATWWLTRSGWQLVPAELFKTAYYRLFYGPCAAAPVRAARTNLAPFIGADAGLQSVHFS